MNKDKKYHISVKIVSDTLETTNSLIQEFKDNGYEFDGEPITQHNDLVYWTFMCKNNNLIDHYKN